MKKIIFIYNKEMASFIAKDLEILRKHYQVEVIRYSRITDLFFIIRGILWCDVVFSWFASLHSFFAVSLCKILGRKGVVVAGGYDVTSCPEIKYGNALYWWKKWCPVLTLRWANLVLTFSRADTRETIKNTKSNPSKLKLVYLGFDTNSFKIDPGVKKEQSVLTVGRISHSNLLRKGLRLFVESASHLPHTQFTLVGKWEDDSIQCLKSIATSNVRFLNHVDMSQLVEIYRKAKVYVQASHHEAFGCSLAEAMLCECIPVVNRVAALPEVVGDCGLYIKDLTPSHLASTIRFALSDNSDLGKKARERIKNLFPLEKREKSLISTIANLR
jgi:glycosyltransferase involved in cell wall biosynthesis